MMQSLTTKFKILQALTLFLAAALQAQEVSKRLLVLQLAEHLLVTLLRQNSATLLALAI
jgi:hypothetical protein